MARSDRISQLWGTRTPYDRGGPWPERVDMYLSNGLSESDVDRWVQSAAILHSNGDGLDIAVKDGRIVGIRGRAQDRVNHGRLDPKELFGWQANASPDRLTKPLVRREGRLVEASWDDAMGRIVQRSKDLLAEQGPSALAFYTSGQLFLEEYYTLAVVAHGGVGTNHVDGNTRLCTATAAEALKETFGCDGQPGSYTDIDHAEVIALWGHNMAETQTVLWSRILDRLEGPNPPALICVDPRLTPVAKAAAVHLAPSPGTNVALMNGILHDLIANDWVDHAYVDAHTVGFDELVAQVRDYTPAEVARICDVPEEQIREAARVLGTTDRLFSTVLQGFYQSNQATAAAVQVNNIHLLRGMIGKPGCGLLQMNGQPTAQNTREAGADGDMAAFRNWNNLSHVDELARIWNIEPNQIPHATPPTHAMQMMRYAEEGSIRLLWVSATNPVVSLPELERIRSILEQERLFLVVQDIFLTETAQLADVVLPAAAWAEKTGTFTNADRTVHLSEKAIDPPGEARPDLDIFIDYAERMGLQDKDGQPLVKWRDPESAFEAWKECSRGRPCDYSGLSYEKLRGKSGIQWPCTADAPEGTERLYSDGRFWASPDMCENYGRDLLTGAPIEENEYKAMNPDGKAMLKPADYSPPQEIPSAEYPLQLITGRTVYHFHTRTKTGRAPQLDAAAPDVWVEVSEADAVTLGLGEGDLAEIRTPRGRVEARVRVSGIRKGVIFLPFHYGYWDTDAGHEPDGAGRAANELTITAWDAASKQPIYKTAAASVTKLAPADGRRHPPPRRRLRRPSPAVPRRRRAGRTPTSKRPRRRPQEVQGEDRDRPPRAARG